MRKTLLISLMLFIGLVAEAQQIVVKSFRALPTDMTASSLEGKRIDQNGNVAALIKVVTTETGFIFEGGSLGVIDQKQQTGEIWVWVPYGLRKITLKHQRLGVFRDYVFPVNIEAERTYEMVLVTGRVETVVKPVLLKQFLVFHVDPPDALLTVDGDPWPLIDGGVAEMLVDFGTHEYRVEAPDYHPTAGRIQVNDPDNKVVENIKLRAAFGFLKIDGDASLLGESRIYLDNANASEALRAPMRVKSGKHTVRIVHPKYKPFVQTVEIADGQTTELRADLDANFVTVTLAVDGPAEIYLDGERKGVQRWTGEVSIGRHMAECRRKNYHSSVNELNIDASKNGQTLTLDAPVAITGSLSVSTVPSMAKLSIDGKTVGETPMLISELTVGNHELKMEKKGYVTQTKTVTIAENELLEVKEALERLAGTEGEKPQEEPEQKASSPSQWFATANVGYSPAPQWSFGASVGSARRVGWFVTAMSNFSFTAMNATMENDANGFVDGEYPGYTGSAMSTRLSLTAGMMLQLTDPLYLRVGAGYGTRVRSLMTSQGDWVKSSADSVTGVECHRWCHVKAGSCSLQP